MRRLKQVARLSYGDALPSQSRSDGPVAVMGSNGKVGVHKLANTRGPCVVIGRKGSFGKVNYSRDPVFAIDTTFFVDSRSFAGELRWLYYMLGWLKLDSVSKDSAVPGLDRQDAHEQPVVLPPIDEQAAIVRFLDHTNHRIDAFIRGKRKLIALAREQHAGIVSRALAGGLRGDVKTRSSGVGWPPHVPQHWEVVSAGTGLSLIQTGPFGSQLHASEYVSEGGVPVINPMHIQGGQLAPQAGVAITEARAQSLPRHRLEVDDIIVARRGELGRCAVVRSGSQGWLCGTGCLKLRTNAEVFVPDYFQLLFSSPPIAAELMSSSVGATMSNLNERTVTRLRLPRPPIAEQLGIVEHLNQVTGGLRRTEASLEREIALMREYRARLIADVVTGQLDVREAAKNLPDLDPTATATDPELDPDPDDLDDDTLDPDAE